MNSERAPIITSLMISLALNSTIFLTADRLMGPQARWHRPQALGLVARNRARKIELEFVEAPPQKILRKPERTKKIAERDSLAQDLGKLKSNAVPAPAIAKAGPADQLNQRRLEDMPVMPLRPPQPTPPQPTVPKEAPKAEDPPQPSPLPGDPQSWLPIKSATTEKKIEDKTAQDRAEEKALDKAAVTLSSRDRITTMEMAVKRSSGAPFQGVTSFEATGSGMGAYMKNLKDRIWLQWFPYIAFRYPMNFDTADAVVRFTVGKQGEVKSVEVLNYRGNPMFATFCMESIRNSSGFGPLPKELLAMIGRDELEIKFAFHYR